MTREEAVKMLQATRLMLMDGANQPISDLYYALDMAIEALEQTEPQTEKHKCRRCLFYNISSDCYPCSECVDYSNYEPKDEPQTETEVARTIIHKMIDNTDIAEDAYPGLRQRLHGAVDEYEPQKRCDECIHFDKPYEKRDKDGILIIGVECDGMDEPCDKWTDEAQTDCPWK